MSPTTTWVDEDGAVWPVTGSWCATCGRPMIPPGEDGSHPLCAGPVTVAVATAPDDPPDDRRPFTPPTGPGRCPACGFHTPTQGHRDDCPEETR